MAQSSDLEAGCCLTWRTEIPFTDRPRRSSNFSLLGSEWYLQFTLKSYPDYYCISLHKKTKTELLRKAFKVTTYIQHPISDSQPLCSQIQTVARTGANIWKGLTKNDLFTMILWFYEYSELKIVCVLHDVLPSMLHTKNGTMHLSTGNDLLASPDVRPDLENLSLDFCNLLEDGDFPDVKLKCGDRTFPAHKLILAARSHVFSSKFRNKMAVSESDGESGESDIAYVTDLDANILELLLKYMYSGRIPDLSTIETALSLYEAGEKYIVPALKRTCLGWMTRRLTEANCVGFLTAAEEHGNVAFKEPVVSFLCEHQAVLTSESWLKFAKEHSELALEVYHKFVTSKT